MPLRRLSIEEQEVEQLFTDIAKRSMKSFHLVGFRNTFNTLFYKVIIPTAVKHAAKKDKEIEALKEELKFAREVNALLKKNVLKE